MAKRRSAASSQSELFDADLFGNPIDKPAPAAPMAAPTAASAKKTPPPSAPDTLSAPMSAPMSDTLSDTPLASRFSHLPAAWRGCLEGFMASETFGKLCAFVDGERQQGKIIYPDDPFRALHLTAANKVKVVILGQDPYHGEDRDIPQAHGLAFSVRPGVRPPPSLKNIYKEISAEFGFPIPTSGCLDHWAEQGVLLLNTVLTVERDKAASHAKRGWEACTDALIAQVGAQKGGIVFMLWGAHAQAKRALLAKHAHHLVLEAPHPSPLSAHRGFLGCGHFEQANRFLEESGRTPIDWRIPATF